MEQYFVLENGVKLPKIGYGTYKSTDGSGGRIIRMALEAGYRPQTLLVSKILRRKWGPRSGRAAFPGRRFS